MTQTAKQKRQTRLKRIQQARRALDALIRMEEARPWRYLRTDIRECYAALHYLNALAQRAPEGSKK